MTYDEALEFSCSFDRPYFLSDMRSIDAPIHSAESTSRVDFECVERVVSTASASIGHGLLCDLAVDRRKPRTVVLRASVEFKIPPVIERRTARRTRHLQQLYVVNRRRMPITMTSRYRATMTGRS